LFFSVCHILPVSIFPIIRHGQQAHFVMRQKRNFIFEVSPHVSMLGPSIDGSSSGAISFRDITSLHHEARDYSVHRASGKAQVDLGHVTPALYAVLYCGRTKHVVIISATSMQEHVVSLSFQKHALTSSPVHKARKFSAVSGVSAS
jgi:hypothetical protein